MADGLHFSRERQAQIRDHLQRDGEVRTMGLAQLFNVSVETVRRDLSKLEKSGHAIRNHGGAAALVSETLPQIGARIGSNRAAKEHIARLARSLITENMSVFIGGGSTTLATAWELRRGPAAAFCSTMVDVVVALGMGGQEDVTLCGGLYNRKSRTFYGYETMEMISSRSFDIAFMGASALDLRRGLLGPGERHLELAKTVRKSAAKFGILAPTTAFERTDKWMLLPWREIDILITDKQPPADIYAALEPSGIEILF